MLHLNTLYNLY